MIVCTTIVKNFTAQVTEVCCTSSAEHLVAARDSLKLRVTFWTLLGVLLNPLIGSVYVGEAINHLFQFFLPVSLVQTLNHLFIAGHVQLDHSGRYF